MSLELARVAGVKKAKLEQLVVPELATLVESPPGGDGWIHELKLDGYRLLARLERGSVRLLTRSGADWTLRLPFLVRALGRVETKSALIDGELVAIDERGVSNFQLLQNSLDGGHDSRIAFYAFDLLHFDGYDWRQAGCRERRRALAEVHATFEPDIARLVRFSQHFQGHGSDVFRSACALGVEGIVSKRADAPYRSGRARDWLKVKCLLRQEFVVVGYTEPAGSRQHVGALLLGVQRHRELHFAGKVGTGFSVGSLAELVRKLAPLTVSRPEVAGAPQGARGRGVHWVKPELVAEISFSGFTEDGRLRHPSFLGLREDKSAAEVVPERAEVAP
jgi:bifunctional non-homologous end joining protein LigD